MTSARQSHWQGSGPTPGARGQPLPRKGLSIPSGQLQDGVGAGPEAESAWHRGARPPRGARRGSSDGPWVGRAGASSLCTGRGVAQGETISSSRAAANGLACWPVARKKNDWKLGVMPSVMCQLDWAARHPVFGYAASGRSVRVFRVRLAFESTKE